MGRWRPPPPKSSPYITASGYERLREELRELWVRRRDVVAALSAAAAEGDRSENAEYIYRKKQLAGIDRRIRYLQRRLPVLNVVAQAPNELTVRFGAWVEVENDDGELARYRIVGADEIDHAADYISIDAPVARALLGKTIDDEIAVETKGGRRTLTVLSIAYDR